MQFENFSDKFVRNRLSITNVTLWANFENFNFSQNSSKKPKFRKIFRKKIAVENGIFKNKTCIMLWFLRILLSLFTFPKKNWKNRFFLPFAISNQQKFTNSGIFFKLVKLKKHRVFYWSFKNTTKNAINFYKEIINIFYSSFFTLRK